MNREPIIQGADIHRLIPQRPPIVMVDKFFGIEENCSFSGLTIAPDNLFCEDGKLQEAGIIEHMAQSAAARVGYIYTEKGEKVPLGFIGGIDKLHIHRLPEAGSELITEVIVIQEVFDITLIGAKTQAGDQLIAECRMKIYLKKE